jgi:manganese/zinc/iron transport system substrate-binding protein
MRPIYNFAFGAAAFCISMLGTRCLSAEATIKAAATVSMVGDLVRQIGGQYVTVDQLMGPGVDPHLYKVTASDLAKLRNADLVFYSGLALEGKMGTTLTQMAKRKPTFAVTDSIPKEALLSPPEFAGHPDPHVWFEIPLWATCIDPVVKALSQHSPQHRAYFESQGEQYKKKLTSLHQWALNKCAEIPPERRVLATSHDAFNYFGRAYGFKVVGLQGISTVTEASLADVVKMVEFIKRNKVKAVFVESSVSHKTIERVSQDAGVKIGGELFSDATGTPGQMESGYDLGTYEGMIKHNIVLIVEALR